MKAQGPIFRMAVDPTQEQMLVYSMNQQLVHRVALYRIPQQLQ